MTAAFILTKARRDALYFQKDGLLDLPWAYLGEAVLAVPVAMATLQSGYRLGPHLVRVVLPLVVAAYQAVIFGWVEPGGGVMMTGLFMSVPLVYGVMFSTTWLLGSELVENLPPDRLSRAYSKLGAASMLGGQPTTSHCVTVSTALM